MGSREKLLSRALVCSELVAGALMDGVERLEAHPWGPWDGKLQRKWMWEAVKVGKVLTIRIPGKSLITKKLDFLILWPTWWFHLCPSTDLAYTSILALYTQMKLVPLGDFGVPIKFSDSLASWTPVLGQPGGQALGVRDENTLFPALRSKKSSEKAPA